MITCYNVDVQLFFEMDKIPLWIIVLSFALSLTTVCSEPLVETRLQSHLLVERKYNKLIRPADNNGSGQLTVELGMRLSQLLNMDEKNQIMTTNIWLLHEWRDSRLTWNPDDFGGIRMTHIRAEDLWRPDIVLYNNADGDFVVTLLTKAAVHYDGNIIWEPPAIYKSYCPINVEFFPFDQQECFMKFGCWTYNGQEVDLQHVCASHGTYDNTGVMIIPRGIDLKEYYQNVEWDVINVTARRKEKSYPCCPETFLDITFNITLRRRTLFYTINLIIPCISISALTVLVFYLPSDSGEKITLSISILLALTVFFLLLSDINPPTSLVMPLIGKYLMFTMLVVTLSICMTVYTLSINFRSSATHSMSPWVRKVFIEILPKILLMKKRPVVQKRRRTVIQTEHGSEVREMKDDTVSSDITNCTSSPAYENLRQRHTSDDVKKTSDLSKYSTTVQDSIKGLDFIAEHLTKDDLAKRESADWKYVAMVMDRLFLFIFTTACLSGTMGIFLNAPSLYDPREQMPLYDPLFNCTY